MADFRAIMAVTEAIINLLRSSYVPDDFNNELEFKVFTSRDFTTNSIANGASLFPYRIYTNGSYRTPAGRISGEGDVYKSKLPLEIHCLITVWGKEASLQNTLAGWIMRTLEDNASLPANLLNSVVADVFFADETVELSLAELTTEDLFRIWEVVGMNVYQLSIPYVVRIIEIDSLQLKTEDGGVVQHRQMNYQNMES